MTQALRNNQTLYANETQIPIIDNKNSTEQVNKTVVVTSNPLEVGIKKPNRFRTTGNLTVLGMRGSASESKVQVDKERGKRSPLQDYDYPSGSDIASGDFSMRSVDASPLLDSASFERAFAQTRRSLSKGNKDPSSFMSSTFFSSEDFIHSPLPDLSLSFERSRTEEEDYTDEKDAYDIHGYRGVAEDRSAGPHPPAYGLAKHDFKPSRGGQPVSYPQRKGQPVSSYKTNVIHRYPGLALPGTSTESSAGLDMNRLQSGEANKSQAQGMNDAPAQGNKSEEDESDEHHHHHFYDQLRHVHINPPKGFDPDSFRLTLPHFIKKGKYVGKKHKHFHHIQNAPVIIKYEPATSQTPPVQKKRQKRPTGKPLTESEEEAMYDEEGEISEKEIENAYKNYDDSAVTQALNNDNDYEAELEESDEQSGEETKIKEVKTTLKAAQKKTGLKTINKTSKHISNTINNNVTKNPDFLSNFWNIRDLLK